MKYKLLLIVLLLNSNLFACCGCSVVESAMESVQSTFNESLNSYDRQNNDYYKNQILQNLNNDLVQLDKRFTELKNTISVNRLNIVSEDECKEQLKKSAELKSISKTQDILLNFEKKQ